MSILVVDLSSILVPHYHAHGRRVGGDDTSGSAIRAVEALVRHYGQNGVAICCDCPWVPTWRHELLPSYKANRDPWDDELLAQYERAKRLLSESYVVFAAEGFEADDLIASVVARMWRDPADYLFVVASGDKDLAQMVCRRVRVYNPAKRRLMDAAAVREVHKVPPDLIRDLLCLVGDKSDGIPGIKGVGEVRAVQILDKFGSLAAALLAVARAASAEECGLTPSVFAALRGGTEAAEMARKLVSLRKDAPIDIPTSVYRRAP